MPTRTEIIEAGARAIKPVQWPHWDDCDADRKYQLRKRAEAALSAMLPLIKAQFAAEVRGKCEGNPINRNRMWCHECREIWPCPPEKAARIIEEYGL